MNDEHQRTPTARERGMYAQEPFDFVGAVAANRASSEAQHLAEQFLSEKTREAADAESEYRKLLATKIVEARRDGHAATSARDIARGDKEVRDLQVKRDVAEGMKEAAAQSIWRHTADRRAMEKFIEWSLRASFLDQADSDGRGLAGVVR